jgi:hypothetical protein
MSWAVLKDFMFTWDYTELYFLYSWETFWDFVAIMGTLLFAVYTLSLLV